MSLLTQFYNSGGDADSSFTSSPTIQTDNSGWPTLVPYRMALNMPGIWADISGSDTVGAGVLHCPTNTTSSWPTVYSFYEAGTLTLEGISIFDPVNGTVIFNNWPVCRVLVTKKIPCISGAHMYAGLSSTRIECDANLRKLHNCNIGGYNIRFGSFSQPLGLEDTTTSFIAPITPDPSLPTEFYCPNAKLNAASVNKILTDLASLSWQSGPKTLTLDGGTSAGSSSLTAAGNAAKSALIAAGWTIILNP